MVNTYMDRRKNIRLSFLFEKMTANKATVEEQVELKVLYQEYIDEGRDFIPASPNVHSIEKRYSYN